MPKMKTISCQDGSGDVGSLVSKSRSGVCHFSNLVSALIPCLVGLPTEILERIPLHLPGQDIVKMEVVRGVVPDPV